MYIELIIKCIFINLTCTIQRSAVFLKLCALKGMT